MQKMQTLLLLTQQSLPNFRPHGNWLWLTLKKVVVINSVGWNHLCWWSGFEIKSTSKKWFCLFQVFCKIKKQTGTRRKDINSLFGRGFNSRHLHQINKKEKLIRLFLFVCNDFDLQGYFVHGIVERVWGLCYNWL